MELTEEQQKLWDDEYGKHYIIAKLLDNYDYYNETTFDAYKAYDYLNQLYKLDYESASWTIKNRDRIILFVDEYQNNSKGELLLRKEYLQNRIKIPKMDLSTKTFLGLMHLAKVLGYDTENANWDNNGGKSLIASMFPLDRYTSFCVWRMDARIDEKEYFGY